MSLQSNYNAVNLFYTIMYEIKQNGAIEQTSNRFQEIFEN